MRGSFVHCDSVTVDASKFIRGMKRAHRAMQNFARRHGLPEHKPVSRILKESG